MSLILKGVDLPTNGETLIVGIYGNGLVGVEHSKPIVLPIEINADAIQIPKGHGRLIDGDKFKETMGDTNMDIYTDEVKEYIDDAPTILEAEAEI